MLQLTSMQIFHFAIRVWCSSDTQIIVVYANVNSFRMVTLRAQHHLLQSCERCCQCVRRAARVAEVRIVITLYCNANDHEHTHFLHVPSHRKYQMLSVFTFECNRPITKKGKRAKETSEVIDCFLYMWCNIWIVSCMAPLFHTRRASLMYYNHCIRKGTLFLIIVNYLAFSFVCNMNVL